MEVVHHVRLSSRATPPEVNMSDVGDVNRVHQNNPEESIADAYMRAARKMVSPSSTVTDRLGFISLHNARNVVMLANIIDALRDENALLMGQIFPLDSEDET